MKKSVPVRLDPDMVARIAEQAKAEHRTISGQAGYLLELGMRAHEARFDRSAGQAREFAEALEAAR